MHESMVGLLSVPGAGLVRGPNHPDAPCSAILEATRKVVSRPELQVYPDYIEFLMIYGGAWVQQGERELVNGWDKRYYLGQIYSVADELLEFERTPVFLFAKVETRIGFGDRGLIFIDYLLDTSGCRVGVLRECFGPDGSEPRQPGALLPNFPMLACTVR
jgi:hypothetical protein